METAFQYDIPVWHPLLVHFPIALILTGALVVVVWSVRGTTFWRHAALLLFGLGLLGGIAAHQTGEAMEEQVEGTPIVEELVDMHEDAALYTLLVTGAVLLGLAFLSGWQARRPPPPAPDPLVGRLLLLFMALAAAALVAWTGHLGGTMVWGVG